MFNVQVRLLVNGRPLGTEELVDGFIQEVAHRVASEVPPPSMAPQTRPPLLPQ